MRAVCLVGLWADLTRAATQARGEVRSPPVGVPVQAAPAPKALRARRGQSEMGIFPRTTRARV